MPRRLLSVLMLVALAACDGAEPPRKPPLQAEMIVPDAPAGAARATPKGARIEPSGFATILSAPPTDYEPPAPPAPLSTPRTAPAMPVVAPEIAHLIRLLPRVQPQPVDDRNVLTTLEALPIATATVILKDGCFRLAGDDEPLVLFTVGVRAFLDGEGYLAVGAADDPSFLSARVGERIQWEGRIEPVAEPAITGPINRVCGAGKVVRIGLASSDSARWSVQDASTAREMASRYGMPYAEARRELRTCRANYHRRWAELRARYGDRDPPAELLPGACMLTPPLPVQSPADCPPGTTHRGALCLDDEGHVVPVPPRQPMG